MAECVEPVIQNLDMSINDVRSIVSEDPFKKYWSKRIDMGFKPQNEDDEKDKNEFIRTYNAHLFLPFKHITMSHFRAFILKTGNIDKHQTLFGIIETSDTVGNSIYLTQCIADIVGWMKFVRKRLNGRISKKEIFEKNEDGEYIYTSQWLLNKVKDENLGDKHSLKEKWSAFVNCFNFVARRITNSNQNESEFYESREFSSSEVELDEDINGILLGHDIPSSPITMITPKDVKKGIEPSDVPLFLCINYPNSSIHAILRHLVSVNQLILEKCRANLKDDDVDTIALRNISRKQDCVDLDETEFIAILQNCTQQSLEYGKASTFSMNLALLEAKLYERYIVGKKWIDYDQNQLLFTFAGQHNIKSYVDDINHLFDPKRNRDKLYFEECSQSLLDILYKKLIQTKSSKDLFISNRERARSIKDQSELQLIASTKRGIEQILIALLRWPTLPNRDCPIYDFMNNNLKLFDDESQIFKQMKAKLFLKHCECVWAYLDKLYIIKQAKWYKLPKKMDICFESEIKDGDQRVKLKQLINQFDPHLLWQFLRDWLEFMERRLCSKNLSKYAEYSLKGFLEKDGLSAQILAKFPDEIRLSQCGDAYKIVAHQYKTTLSVI